MASIFKRGDSGIWYLKYYLRGQQVYQSLGTTSERVAKKRQAEVEVDGSRGDLLAPSTTPLPAFLEDFAGFLSTIRTAKSYSGDISLLRVFFGPICPALHLGSHTNRRFRDGQEPLIPDPFKRRHVPARTLEEITPEVIETFLCRRLRLDKIAAKTANRQREILHRMFAYAIKKWRFVSLDRRFPNPAAAVERRREPAPQIRYLTLEQIPEQLAALGETPTLYALVATYIYAGLRREEGLWLTLEDVDLERRLLQVRAKTIDGKFWQPKTKRNRAVPISEALCAILAAYQPQRTGPWYFPSPLRPPGYECGKPITRKSLLLHKLQLYQSFRLLPFDHQDNQLHQDDHGFSCILVAVEQGRKAFGRLKTSAFPEPDGRGYER